MAKTAKKTRSKKAANRTAARGRASAPNFDSADLFDAANVSHRRASFMAAAHGLTKSITATEILRRLTTTFGWVISSSDDPIGNFIRGGAQALRAFPISLNRKGIFSDDGINFAVGEFDGFTKIGQLGAAIIQKYRDNGWYVH